MVFACVPAYALSALWTHPPAWVYGSGIVAAWAKVTGLVYFLRLVRSVSWKSLRTPLVRGLWLVAGVSFVSKLFLQAGSAIPAAAQLAYEQRNIVIAYLHLVFIGLVSCFLLGYLLQQRLLPIRSRRFFWGIACWIIFFVFHELVLILQPFTPIASWFYQAMFVLSLWMWGAVGVLFWATFRHSAVPRPE